MEKVSVWQLPATFVEVRILPLERGECQRLALRNTGMAFAGSKNELNFPVRGIVTRA